MNKIRFLTLTEVIEMHAQVINVVDNIKYVNLSLLDSAINFPLMIIAYSEQEEEKDICYLAAAYLFHIIKNHPFKDGNKRTALVASLSFLKINNVRLQTDEEEMYKLSLRVAVSYADKYEIALYFKSKRLK